nr:MAG TPA: hypothetical protein [Caudoviricetes sp.]
MTSRLILPVSDRPEFSLSKSANVNAYAVIFGTIKEPILISTTYHRL